MARRRIPLPKPPLSQPDLDEPGVLPARLIGEFVRGKRADARLSRQDLADLAGVGRNFIYDLETGKPTVRLDALDAVLRVLGKTVGITDRPRPVAIDER